MLNNNEKPKYMWEDEDWDKVSPIHRLHRDVTGVPLVDSLVKFYIYMPIVAFFAVIFFN